jgi:hypothetical protein
VSYSVRYGNDEEAWSHRSTLLIIEDDGVTRTYSDCMEPEDTIFSRDLSWIKEELERAYQRGRKDAKRSIRALVDEY